MLKEVVSSSHVAAGKTLAAHSIHIGQTFVHSNLIWYESDHQTHALPSTVIPTVYKYRVSRVLHNCSILLKVLLVLEEALLSDVVNRSVLRGLQSLRQ